MQPTTRRGFLLGVAAAAAGPLGLLARPARAIPPIGRTRASHLKLSVAAYSYRQYLTGHPPKIDLFDFVNLAVGIGDRGRYRNVKFLGLLVPYRLLHPVVHRRSAHGLDQLL